LSETLRRAKSKSAVASYDRRVFINCPFDRDYLPLLQAISFAVIDCGFSPRLAIQEVNGRLRLEKMIDLMRNSRLAIHDISRLPSDPGDLPRFNMPFECGVFVGMEESSAKRHREKQFLVLDATAHLHQRTMSDVAGLDPKIHGNDPRKAMDAVRHFLASELRGQNPRQESAPGGASIWRRYQRFLGELPSAVYHAKLTAAEILSFDYLSDLIELMADWIKARP
jgi:hypothetical protein